MKNYFHRRKIITRLIICRPSQVINAPDLRSWGQGVRVLMLLVIRFEAGVNGVTVSSAGDDPALNGYLEKSRGKQRKRQIICLQPCIALPAKGIESEDWSAYENVF